MLFEHMVFIWPLIGAAVFNTSFVRAGTIEEGSTSTSQDNKQTFVPGSAGVTRGRVMLTISARNLTGRDYLSKSDPMCVVRGQPFGQVNPPWIDRGHTETISDNHNPDFVTKITLDYHFDELQPLRFEIYDIDAKSSNLNDHDFLGFAKCNLGKIVHERKVELFLNEHKSEIDMTDAEIASKRLNNKQKTLSKKASSFLRVNTGKGQEYIRPTIIVRAEEVKSGDETTDNLIIIELKGRHIAGSSWFRLNKPNPYIDIYKAIDKKASDYVLVHRTETVKFSSGPHWRRFMIFFSTLASEDRDRKLKFVCKNWHKMNDHGYIGEFVTTVAEIEETRKKNFDLINTKKNTPNNSYGFLRFETFEKMKTASFLEYVMGSLELNCFIAIDFTASNGSPQNSNSLHRTHPPGSSILNHYEQAIISVVSILEDYDTDKLFPTYGYGAELPGSHHVSHVFPVNLNNNNPDCEKVEGVLRAYRNCITRIHFEGPTYFNPVIEHVVKQVRNYKGGEKYAILLILTDGQINDMEKTIRTIVNASKLPLSIIIVGVGSANFNAMEELDADGEPLEYRGKIAKRDIVQFVPFNKFFTRENDPVAKERLAKEVLAEVPKQLITYMAINKFKPKLKRVDTKDLSSSNTQHYEGQTSKIPPNSQISGDKKFGDVPSTSEVAHNQTSSWVQKEPSAPELPQDMDNALTEEEESTSEIKPYTSAGKNV